MSSRSLLVEYPYNTKNMPNHAFMPLDLIPPKKLFLQHLLPKNSPRLESTTAQHCHCILPRGLQSLASGRLGLSNLSELLFFFFPPGSPITFSFLNSSLLHLTLSLVTYPQSVDKFLLNSQTPPASRPINRNKKLSILDKSSVSITKTETNRI